MPHVPGYLRGRISTYTEKPLGAEMFDSTLYVKSEMDYKTEKIKRGTAVRRHRNRKPLTRRQSHQSEPNN